MSIERKLISQNQKIIKNLVEDISKRLSVNSIFNLSNFSSYQQTFKSLKNDGEKILSNPQNMNSREITNFVLDYYDTMNLLVENHDGIKYNNYYSNFTRDNFPIIYSPSKYTNLILDDKLSNLFDIIDWRPHCVYPICTPKISEFSMNKLNYEKANKLINDNLTHFIDGDYENFREVAFHDFGHVGVMKRLDTWLFSTSLQHPQELIRKWIKNKNIIIKRVNSLKNSNENLWNAIRLYLFDISHDHGYQFELTLLMQQLETKKNLNSIYSKMKNLQFGHLGFYCDYNLLGSARNYLLDIVGNLLRQQNISALKKKV